MFASKIIKKAGATALLLMGAATFAHQSAHADQLDVVTKRGKLIVGVKNDYQPFGWVGNDGQIRGFEIDLAKYVAKELTGKEDAVELVPVVASNRIELLNAGRIDVIFATLGVNENRAKVIDFTDEYYMMEGLVLVTPNETSVQKWEDLKGRSVCGSQGNLYNRTLTQKYGADMLLYTGTAEIFKSFESGRCEAIAFDGPIMQQKVNDETWKDKYKIALPTLELIPIAGGVRKNESRFLDAINKAIRAAEADNVLVDAEKEYGMGESEYVQERAETARKASGS